MKSNTKKRLIAFMLCMVLVLSSTISAFADEPQNTDSQSQAEVVTEPAADEATEDTTTEDVSTENTITEDVSDTPDIEIPSKKEWSVQVGNATVKVNGWKVKVTKTTVENKASSHAAGVDYGADNVPVKLFTGELVLLKYGDGNVNNALANAEFVLYKDGEEVPLTFTKQENGKYKYAPDAEDATATLVTDENGMIDVEGLDVGSYHFEETKAPEGYSINTDGKTLTLTVNGDVATAKLYNEGQLNDTKLSALPSTGGIGTTIFTIAGCVIMIAAAGLFFASRKKSDNK